MKHMFTIGDRQYKIEDLNSTILKLCHHLDISLVANQADDYTMIRKYSQEGDIIEIVKASDCRYMWTGFSIDVNFLIVKDSLETLDLLEITILHEIGHNISARTALLACKMYKPIEYKFDKGFVENLEIPRWKYVEYGLYYESQFDDVPKIVSSDLAAKEEDRATEIQTILAEILDIEHDESRVLNDRIVSLELEMNLMLIEHRILFLSNVIDMQMLKRE